LVGVLSELENFACAGISLVTLMMQSRFAHREQGGLGHGQKAVQKKQNRNRNQPCININIYGDFFHACLS
jgi:hypothetical protein